MSPGRTRRTGMIAAVAVVPIIVAACGGSSSSDSAPAKRTHYCPASAGLGTKVNDKGVAKATGATLKTFAQDSYFNPTCITGAAAGPITFTVTNSGASLHNISIPDQGIDRDIAPGASVTVNATVGTAPLHYFCKYHKGSGMVGAVIPAQ